MNPPTTEEEESTPADPLGRRGLPWKLSDLRRKPGQKAKQELFHCPLIKYVGVHAILTSECRYGVFRKKFRFYALYDRIYRPDVLLAAYQQVRKLRSAAGVDGVRFEDIEETPNGVSTFVAELHEDLKTKRYRPSAVKRVHIPKADGGTRPLDPFLF